MNMELTIALKVLLDSVGLYHYVPCGRGMLPQLFFIGTSVKPFFYAVPWRHKALGPCGYEQKHVGTVLGHTD